MFASSGVLLSYLIAIVAGVVVLAAGIGYRFVRLRVARPSQRPKENP